MLVESVGFLSVAACPTPPAHDSNILADLENHSILETTRWRLGTFGFLLDNDPAVARLDTVSAEAISSPGWELVCRVW